MRSALVMGNSSIVCGTLLTIVLIAACSSRANSQSLDAAQIQRRVASGEQVHLTGHNIDERITLDGGQSLFFERCTLGSLVVVGAWNGSIVLSGTTIEGELSIGNPSASTALDGSLELYGCTLKSGFTFGNVK